jgi:hypothetical protein
LLVWLAWVGRRWGSGAATRGSGEAGRAGGRGEAAPCGDRRHVAGPLGPLHHVPVRARGLHMLAWTSGTGAPTRAW